MNKLISMSIFALLMVGCATAPETTMTPLEVQAMQSREYPEDKEIVFPAVMSVFQDLGYTIETAGMDTGLIRAQGAADSNASTKFWLGITKVSQTAASAYIETVGSTTKVRLNFVVSEKISFGYGQTDRQDTPIYDAQTYQAAFERIESAIFVRSSN